MQPNQSTLPDKTIVDRRRHSRDDDLRQTLSETREKLSDSASVDPTFDRKLLRAHLHAIGAALIVLPILIGVTTGVAFLTGFGLEVFIWAAVSMCLYGGVIAFAKWGSGRTEETRFNMRLWSIGLVAAHTIAGLTWAYWVLLPCSNCSAETGLLFKAMVLLIAMAATTTICFTLRWATLAAFTVPILTFLGATLGNPTLSANIIAVMLVLALAFFTLLATRLNIANQTHVSIQAKNDALIAELELAKSMSEEARRRAEEANLAKSRFLATMSHELRTPLNAILGFSEVMTNEILGPIDNEKYAEYINDIHASGEHLLKVINEILDLSRVEAGKYDMNPEPLELSVLAEHCLTLVHLSAAKKQIQLQTDFELDLPKVIVDERSMRQILLNLLSNAIKFTPQNGSVTVTIGWTAAGGQYLTVSDTGPGIPHDEIPLVLSAFGQGAISIKTAQSGTGLGLPIVQALTKLHDGSFKLESTIRKGTKATVILPATRTLKEATFHEPTEKRRQSA